MWLLPDQKWPNGTRAFVALGACHFGPTHALVALHLRGGPGFFHDVGVIGHLCTQVFGALPHREVYPVPPVHFQMEFTVPTVVGQAGFLRGQSARTVDAGKVLGQHYTALQFFGAGIGTL